MADAADSKSVGRKAVWVRLPPPAPIFFNFIRKSRTFLRAEPQNNFQASLLAVQHVPRVPPEMSFGQTLPWSGSFHRFENAFANFVPRDADHIDL